MYISSFLFYKFYKSYTGPVDVFQKDLVTKNPNALENKIGEANKAISSRESNFTRKNAAGVNGTRETLDAHCRRD